MRPSWLVGTGVIFVGALAALLFLRRPWGSEGSHSDTPRSARSAESPGRQFPEPSRISPGPGIAPGSETTPALSEPHDDPEDALRNSQAEHMLAEENGRQALVRAVFGRPDPVGQRAVAAMFSGLASSLEITPPDDVDCGQSVCVAEWMNETFESYMRLQHELGSSRGIQQEFIIYAPNDDHGAQVFMTREGPTVTELLRQFEHP